MIGLMEEHSLIWNRHGRKFDIAEILIARIGFEEICIQGIGYGRNLKKWDTSKFEVE